MNLINTVLIWSWLLGISLLVPTTLPAGGAQKSIIKFRENSIRSPLIVIKKINLHSATYEDSSILMSINSGTPVQVLNFWDSPDSGKWILVNVFDQNYHQLFSKRGWLNIGTY